MWLGVVLLALTLGPAVGPLAAEGQQARKTYRVGVLQANSPADAAARMMALERGLADLGYVAGRNVEFINRNAGTELDRLPELAAELARSRVDVIVTSTNPTTLAVMKATTTIPIVMTIAVEPVAAGLVKSIANPGGNVTGLTFDVDATQLSAKRLELLKELLPSLSRVAVLWNPTYGPGRLRLRGTEDAARKLGIASIDVSVSDPGDLDRTFSEMRRARVDAVTVLSDPMIVARRVQIVQLAARYGLPAIYALREFVEAGGLLSYATTLGEQYRRAASYVAKILKGAKPADLPIEQPSKFELVINMKTAKALGLTIPQSLLNRADQVIHP
jgi:putative tryptophan/tyrosine transport system substrate-binding protein